MQLNHIKQWNNRKSPQSHNLNSPKKCPNHNFVFFLPPFRFINSIARVHQIYMYEKNKKPSDINLLNLFSFFWSMFEAWNLRQRRCMFGRSPMVRRTTCGCLDFVDTLKLRCHLTMAHVFRPLPKQNERALSAKHLRNGNRHSMNFGQLSLCTSLDFKCTYICNLY